MIVYVPTWVFAWLVLMVIVEVAWPEPGVTEEGEKLQVDFAGSPKQERKIG
jgi:hypothetical protein